MRDFLRILFFLDESLFRTKMDDLMTAIFWSVIIGSIIISINL